MGRDILCSYVVKGVGAIGVIPTTTIVYPLIVHPLHSPKEGINFLYLMPLHVGHQISSSITE